MSEANDQTTGTKAKIAFLSNHMPQLVDGDYTISVKQVLSGPGIPAGTESSAVTRYLSVEGERFALKPADIHAVFPPEGSLGDYRNVLPHVILERSTLPWERKAGQEKDDQTPWLALLLFAEGEAPEPQSVTAAALATRQDTGTGVWPGISLRNGMPPNKDDKIEVIDVDLNLLKSILPAKRELTYLAHARLTSTADASETETERAVIIGNRLPHIDEKSKTSVAYLVAVEGRYKPGADGEFDYQQGDNTSTIRLVALKRWRFSCLRDEHTFAGLLTHLNQGQAVSTVRLPDVDSSLAGAAAANRYLGSGAMAAEHTLRDGQKTVSWYRGPLSPNDYSATYGIQHPLNSDQFPCSSADQLVRYDPAIGMFDVSYAAAWELGRLLALSSKHFSLNLYQWKRANSLQIRQIEQQELHPHLPVKTPTHGATLPDVLEKWLSKTSLLQDVPFNYLVPDAGMLPAESIRFFMLDPLWIACLLDGAFSIGRVTSTDFADDEKRKGHLAAIPQQAVSGFLLRSAVVAGWPGLQVNAYDANVTTITNRAVKEAHSLGRPLRMARLSPNILICLFAGAAMQFDIHQKQETIHFGVTPQDDGSFVRPLRSANGLEKLVQATQGGKTVDVPKYEVAVPWRQQVTGGAGTSNGSTARVIDITALYQTIQAKAATEPAKTELGFGTSALNTAEFALQMVEGVPLVSFLASPRQRWGGNRLDDSRSAAGSGD